MTTIDLSTPPPPTEGLLDALPRRVALTLPELQYVAARAGGAPLPFDLQDAVGSSSLEDRLGTSRETEADRSYRRTLEGLHDPESSLSRRGLLVGGSVDAGLTGAVGLLATPTVAVDVDVTVEDVQVKAWHRQAGDAVATLATTDGIVFELAWFRTGSWPGELARVGALPEDLVLRTSAVPAYVDLPYELVDAAVEAAGSGRPDLVPVLVEQQAGRAVDADGDELEVSETAALLQALGTEAQGRLRALVADVTRASAAGDGSTGVVGVRSWVLLADGWRSIHPHETGGTPRVVLRLVEASDLGADLAPVLAEVVG